MSQLFLLALVVGTVSFTISRAKIFEGVREAAASRSLFVARLLGCTYCTSHWVAALATVLYQPRLGVSHVVVLDLVAAGFGLVAMAAPVAGVIAFSYGLIAPAQDAADELTHAGGDAIDDGEPEVAGQELGPTQ